MKFVIAYFIGFIIAAVWSLIKMWDKNFCEEPRWQRAIFSLALGFMSWVLVVIYIILGAYDVERRIAEKHQENGREDA